MDVDQPFREFITRGMALLEGADQSSGTDRRAIDPSHSPSVESLAGDGSNRKLFRVRSDDLSAIAVSNPLPEDRIHPDENEGFLAVRGYLQRRGVRVPAFYMADLVRGYLLLEDLGSLRLNDVVKSEGWEAQKVKDLYADALRSLIIMQAPGSPPFLSESVSNPHYSVRFILEHESGYFHKELVKGVAGRNVPFSEIESECRDIARTALSMDDPGSAPSANLVFMHRDFQSRNLMVVGSYVAVIDFQGARLGPAEYDLAALLYDPYVAMPDDVRTRLTRFYVEEASRAGVLGIPDTAAAEGQPGWEGRFLANSANRLMQALGAYAKLGVRLKRPGFADHIPQALGDLEVVLKRLGGCPRLLALVREIGCGTTNRD